MTMTIDIPGTAEDNAGVASIADQLRQAIRRAERRGVTRYQIAKKSGVSQSMLSRLMSEGHSPRTDIAEKIVQALGGTISINLE